MTKRGFALLAIAAILSISLFFVHADSLETKNVLLKFSLNKGESISKNITISSSTGGVFSLDMEGIDRGVSLGEKSIVLEKEEGRSVSVLFNSSLVSEGVYVGNIKVSGQGVQKAIPVIFEVESKDVFFDGNLEIPSKYSSITPGSQMTVQLNVFDLLSGGGTSGGLGSSSVDVEYSVHDIYGNTLVSEKENFVVDKKVTVSKTITFPKDIKEGQYVFSAVINYKSSIGVATDLFTVSKPVKGNPFSFGNFSESSVILFFFGFLFLAMILFFVYVLHDRDRMVLELRRYNSTELKRGKSLMRVQERVIREKGAGGGEIKKEIDKKINELKKEQKKRIDELKELHKKGDAEEMKRKLKEWKRKGYNTTFMEYKLKGLSQGQMREILKKWKREYKY